MLVSPLVLVRSGRHVDGIKGALTEEGRMHIQVTAKWIARKQLGPCAVFTSSLVRSLESGGILGECLDTPVERSFCLESATAKRDVTYFDHDAFWLLLQRRSEGRIVVAATHYYELMAICGQFAEIARRHGEQLGDRFMDHGACRILYPDWTSEYFSPTGLP